MRVFQCSIYGSNKKKGIPTFSEEIIDPSNNAEDLKDAVNFAIANFRLILGKVFGANSRNWTVKCNLIAEV